MSDNEENNEVVKGEPQEEREAKEREEVKESSVITTKPLPSVKVTKDVIEKEGEESLFFMLGEADGDRYFELIHDLLSDEVKEGLVRYQEIINRKKKEHLSDKEISAYLKKEGIKPPITPEEYNDAKKYIDSSEALLTSGIAKKFARTKQAFMGVEDDQGTFIHQITPKAKPAEKVTSAQSLIAALSFIGLRTTRSVPLFTCGLNLSFITPEDDYVYNALYKGSELKTEYGLATGGYYFSTDTVFTITNLARLAFRYTYASNFEEINDVDAEKRINKLMEIVPITEMNNILLGLATTMYPKGFPLTITCTNDKCKEETQYRENLRYWGHNFSSKLSSDLKRKLRKYKNNITAEHISEYKEEYTDSIPSKRFSVDLENGGKITFGLRIPTIAEYERASTEWIEGIVESVDEFIGKSFMNEKEREGVIASKIGFETINRYIPYIKSFSFEMNDQTVTMDIDDLGDNGYVEISKAIKSISQYTDAVNVIFDKITDYIVDATVTVVGPGLPTCPKCNEDNDNVSSADSNIMLFDPVTLFLVLGERKLSVERNIMKQT